MSVEHNYSPLKEFQESKQAGKHALGFLESQIGLMQVRRQPPQNETVLTEGWKLREHQNQLGVCPVSVRGWKTSKTRMCYSEACRHPDRHTPAALSWPAFLGTFVFLYCSLSTEHLYR